MPASSHAKSAACGSGTKPSPAVWTHSAQFWRNHATVAWNVARRRPPLDTGDRTMANDEIVNVRYMVDDVQESISFYTQRLGFELLTSAAPAFADVKRGNLRLLL